MERVEPLAQAVAGVGLEVIEVTMNTSGAPEMIARMAGVSAGRMLVGAGTVLTCSDAEAALSAGATFLVSPVVVESVAELCARRGVPYFPGALTPAEVYRAAQAGAAMVKLFPASCFGPGYLKELRGPFRDIELLACGGVHAANAGDYFAAGASAVAFGASVFRTEWLARGDYQSIAGEIDKLVRICRVARGVDGNDR